MGSVRSPLRPGQSPGARVHADSAGKAHASFSPERLVGRARAAARGACGGTRPGCEGTSWRRCERLFGAAGSCGSACCSAAGLGGILKVVRGVGERFGRHLCYHAPLCNLTPQPVRLHLETIFGARLSMVVRVAGEALADVPNVWCWLFVVTPRSGGSPAVVVGWLSPVTRSRQGAPPCWPPWPGVHPWLCRTQSSDFVGIQQVSSYF